MHVKKNTAHRFVIVHYHIFKNAGTSVDHVLKECFPDTFMQVDGPVPEFFINQTELDVIVKNRSQLRAISSHQVRLPAPRNPKITYLPMCFVRRPEVRLHSIWRFQRSRNDDYPATLIAKRLEFKDWICRLLQPGKSRGMLNQQAILLAFGYDSRVKFNDPKLRERALANLEQVPFAGLVDEFGDSMRIYKRLYRQYVPDFQFESAPRLNAMGESSETGMSHRLEVESLLGRELLKEVLAKNQIDLELYEYCRARFKQLRADN